MSRMASPTRATFVDALGTLIELEPPWVHLGDELGDGMPPDRVEAAVRAEMRYYRAHSDEGRDPDSLAELRRRCAAVLSAELGRSVDVATLMGAIRFRPYPDARPALERLRRRGLRLICVSNWDFALPDVLERCGLGDLLDGVVTSASAGARKPDPAIFALALELAQCWPADALHVGDTLEEDVEGANAADIPALLLDRDGSYGPAAPDAKRSTRPATTRVPRIASLAEIEQYLRP
jgi:putative hydrolase of the HAD superfamily